MVAEPRRQRSTTLRGAELLNDPLLNKGTAFSRAERRELGLEALLPWQVETIEAQVERCRLAFGAMGSDLERYAYLQTLRERNVTLFHRFLADHIELAMPIVYTPTVGQAIQHFSHSYRSPSQGIYLAAPQQERLEELLAQACGSSDGHGPDLLLVTDAQGILGIGDQGVGGIQICQGKLAVYTLCAGLDPARGLPVMLDVGTDRPELLADPCYPGLRRPRLQGEAYTAFLDRFIDAVQAVCPGALVHWEDFGAAHARPVLEAYRQRVPSFNDDIQGTSGVVSAAVLAACQGLGQTLAEQRIVVFGAGTAGCGIAEGLLRLLQADGLSPQQARQRIWAIDRQGLLVQGMAGMNPGAAALARDPHDVVDMGRNPDGLIDLAAVVAQVRPTVLIGTSTVAGAFSQAVVEAMARHCARPVILPLSNPTALAEAAPADLLAWTGGRALVATGSPFAPVPLPGGARVIGQCNNCFLFPGLGFATVALGLRRISDGMIDAGLQALAEWIPASRNPAAPLMPALGDGAAVAAAVAQAVAIAGVREGLAADGVREEQVPLLLEQARWLPIYPDLQPNALQD